MSAFCKKRNMTYCNYLFSISIKTVEQEVWSLNTRKKIKLTIYNAQKQSTMIFQYK